MSTKDARNTVVVTHDPEDRKGRLKRLGGSQSDHWNNVLANQTANTLWLSKDAETRRRQYGAMSAALRGIEPKDEVEGMIAAQLVAAHNAAMECYRRAMVSEQTFEGRRENLSQANKLSRTYATLLDARSIATAAKASRKSRWSTCMCILAVRPSWEQLRDRVPPIHRDPRTNTMRDKLPMHLSPRCGARTRSRNSCQSPAMPNGRCRMHGGMSPGAPK